LLVVVVAADHVDQASQFSQRVFDALLRSARGAKTTLEFVEIDFGNNSGV